MGVTITSKYKNALELDGGYAMMFILRTMVAKAFDKELGNHYDKLIETIDYKEFDKRTNEILKDKRFKQEDEDIINFLFASDCHGELSYKTCQKIYNLIKAKRTKYPAWNVDWKAFKTLLKECYTNEVNLIWY